LLQLHAISHIQSDGTADIPQVMGDRVQLQQVLMNSHPEWIDAMKDVDGRRDLILRSQKSADGQLLISVSDTGVGLPSQQADQILTHSLLRNLTARAWDFVSAAPSWSRMADACGLPATLSAEQAFMSLYPLSPRLREWAHSRANCVRD